MPKKFKPSKDVHIAPRRTADGGEIWDIAVRATALKKLGKLAGVSKGEADWLHDPLRIMFLGLQHEADRHDRSAAASIKHLRLIQATSRRLQMLLDARTKSEMFSFEDRELRYQLFGTRGTATVSTRVEAQDYLFAVEKAKTGLQEEAQVDRIRTRSTAMIDWLEPRPGEPQRRPAKPNALDPTKHSIAKCALHWWTRFGHSDRRSDSFVAFTDHLYRLAGIRLKPDAIRAQLTAAVKRRNAGSSG
jgi:hypothetical protein